VRAWLFIDKRRGLQLQVGFLVTRSDNSKLVSAPSLSEDSKLVSAPSSHVECGCSHKLQCVHDPPVQRVYHALRAVDCVRDTHAQTGGQLAREQKEEDVGGQVHAVARQVAEHDWEENHAQPAAPANDGARQQQLLVARDGAEVTEKEVAAAKLQTEACVLR